MRNIALPRRRGIHSFQPHAVAGAAAMLATALAGCGGSSSDDSAAAPVAPAAMTVSVPVTVIDGALKGATVCLDKNRNGICDTGEPNATTDANGLATLSVATTDAGLYPVVAMVTANTAIDADTGAVPVSYVLQAPADQTAVVSPLTTLVKAQADATGSTSAQAAAQIQAQTGLANSLFANYTTTKATDAGALAAATLARLVVLTTQAQITALTAAGTSIVGQTDISGATVSTTDVQLAAIDSLLASLPALASAASGASITATSTASAVDAALTTQAASLLALGLAGLNTSTALAAIGTTKLPADTSAATTQPSASLRALSFTDVNNWYYRANESTSADNTVDSTGMVHYFDDRTQDVAATVTSWGFNGSPARQGDLHWNGTSWTGCPLGFRNSQTPRDANGRTTYNYCDSYETGTSQRSAVDVSGKTLGNVVATIRSFPGSDGGVAYANFGPTDLTLLGTATLPAGSLLYYNTSQYATRAFAYDVQPSAVVNAYPNAIAAGGDASGAAGTILAACAAVTSSNSTSFYQPVTTLEALIAANPGTPCVYGPTTSGLALANEWWNNSTVSLGTIAGAATPPGTGVFTTTESLRLAFVPGGNLTRYLSCLVRASDSSTRNCTEIGRGTYAIQTLGDARVLTLTNLPPETLRLGYARVFVERGGKVSFGYQDFAGVTSSIRLNLTAANALFGQLGLPAITPQ